MVLAIYSVVVLLVLPLVGWFALPEIVKEDFSAAVWRSVPSMGWNSAENAAEDGQKGPLKKSVPEVVTSGLLNLSTADGPSARNATFEGDTCLNDTFWTAVAIEDYSEPKTGPALDTLGFCAVPALLPREGF